MSKPIDSSAAKEANGEAGWLGLVRQHVGSLRYGVVQIIVHDAQVIQIEKTERVRLERSGPETRWSPKQPGQEAS